MGKYKERRCQYCWDRKAQTSMTRVPREQAGRDKWICLLGKDFAANISGKDNVFVCRCHFEENSVTGRRSKCALPEFDLKGSGPLRIDEESIEDKGGADESDEEDSSDDSFVAATECSDYSPESEDEEEEEGNSDEEDVDDVIEYAIVEFGILLEALQFCRNCGSSSVEVHVAKPSGYAVNVGLSCLRCRNAWNWYSSPLLRNTKEYTVNRDMTSASVSCGGSFMKVVFERIVENAKENNNEIDVAGDAQFDSPGHTAIHGRYAILDMHTNLVLDTQLIRKSTHSGK
ncbi:hypothetical protein L5515_003308 [Caenorhabditis briggsae]|uniref:THAP-type domain-containing protein n=1 Tax=Caenorhabditis briggsae TaxID=6238 RepID=A0AAE9EK76_CAEBR|nr:hypothetical protein L5515_003308 [Caenorhabditis briggsae]